MYIRRSKRRNGIYLSIIDAYWDPKIKNSRQITVKSLGNIEDLAKIYPDPEAYAQQVLEELEAEKAAATEYHNTVNLLERHKKIDDGSDIPVYSDQIKNVGYGILKRVYLDLKLDKFWAWKSRDCKAEYSVDQIFRLLVFGRILFPGSKKQTYEERNRYFEPIDDFSLDDIYRSLDIIAQNKDAIQQWAFKMSESIAPRDLSLTYFDCTNYYFDISHPDVDLMDDSGNVVDKDGKPCARKYRKRGPEKNQRPDPIVGMGLLIDKNGIPLGFDLFPGNESEKVHMRPIINKFREAYPVGRTIIVADRGLNTSDNIYFVNGDNLAENNNRDGYIYGQTVRGADEEFKKWVLDKKGYVTDYIDPGKISVDVDDELDDLDKKKRIKFIHKSRIAKRKLSVNAIDSSGKTHKIPVVIDQKQMVYYSEKYAQRQKRQRDMMVARANDLIANPKKYDKVTATGAASYVVNLSFDSQGTIVEGKALYLDEKKIKEEQQFDGYYAIASSELEMKDWDLRNAYRGLERIENTFRISKSDFNSRPVFVRTNDHIDAHFTVCYIALLIIRLLQFKLDKHYPVGRIIKSLRSYVCDPIGENVFKFPYYDAILESCEKAFNIELDHIYLKRGEIRKLLRY